jgi:hypothetical protein
MAHLGNVVVRRFLDQVKRSHRPVIIVCAWIKNLEGMHRTLPGATGEKNEWRIGYQLFRVVMELAVKADPRAWKDAEAGVPARLEGIRCIAEELPPDDLLKELTAMAMGHPDTRVER